MAIEISVAAKANIQHAIDLMLNGTAVELPVDSTCMEQVGLAARAISFPTPGQTFEQAMRDNPVTTLLKLVLFVGA
jgi:hypothetical protein